MNYLAHAFLAGPLSSDRVGGIAGDFVRGPLDPLPPGIGPLLGAGLVLHRRIDAYADTHPAFQRSRARVSAQRRRVGGIMVDLFYDHFLAVHWTELAKDLPGESELECFTANTYRLVAIHPEPLPPAFREVFARMAAQDWLASYRDPASVALALDRIGEYRLRQPNQLKGAGEELLENYTGFEEDFMVFLPDALAFAGSVQRERFLVKDQGRGDMS
ncbi:acyl carrier protein phosphodiesterase [Thauera sp. SDU_THAU2]|uniref:acyl carrier protein phosphodiesterase n=1 Tax=Thauera sp. SDU_THAU2 TaxID=3136633 RepID=UPI00311D9355